jgi:hypothetical protein
VDDRLFELPPSEFTAARDDLAKRLRAEGRREQADEVRRMRRPSAAAFAVNRLAQARGDRLRDLLDAQDRLREAQSGAIDRGDREALRDAAAEERALVSELAGDAVGLVAEAGERAPAALRERVATTLHAAATDEALREEVERGRVVREREAVGFGGPAPPASGRRPAGRRRPAAKPQLGKLERAAAAAEADESAAQRAVEAARTRRDAARRGLEQAERDLREAEAERKAAAAAARKARAALERAREG